MTPRSQIQLLLWSYFWLLIFEGALRKWVFPGLSNPLLVIRDPIAVLATTIGLPYLMRSNWTLWVLSFWLIGIISVFTALAFGHGDIFTAFFGARIFWFQLPLIFLFSAVFNYEDTLRFLKATAILAIPMAFLAGLQFSLPQDHFVNLAPGGEGGVGFSGALGKFRPPGTFSFITGLVDFFALAFIGVMAIFFVRNETIPKWTYFSFISIIAVLPISVSRSLLYLYIVNSFFLLFTFLSSKRSWKLMFPFIILLFLSVIFSSFIGTVQDAQEAFLARWAEANYHEGGSKGATEAFKTRMLSNTLDETLRVLDQPIFGQGIGLGSNVGAMRLSGSRDFLVSESAWGMLIGELGPALGVLALFLRIFLALQLLKLSSVELSRGNTLPMLLCGFAITGILLGNTAQPTALGFIVVSSGLLLAACNSRFSDVIYDFNDNSLLSSESHQSNHTLN